MRFQKLTRNLFLTLHGHNVRWKQRQQSKFLMCCQQFASHAYCGASFQDDVAAGKGVLCAPFWGVQICDYSARNSRCTVITVAAADGVRCARVRWEINFLLTFETAPFFCVYPVYFCRKGVKSCRYCTENVRGHCAKFTRRKFVHPWPTSYHLNQFPSGNKTDLLLPFWGKQRNVPVEVRANK